MHVHTQINVWLFISRDTWVCDWTAELRLFRDKQRDPPPPTSLHVTLIHAHSHFSRHTHIINFKLTILQKQKKNI